ncbi:MAG: site-specific integrase [Methanoregula sp.]|jgi:integrase|nr:site-specific integrase [Methanoregula sp.]
MANALTCNSSRVLTPSEADGIRQVIEKPSLKALYDLLLYTGLRFVEVAQLRDNPEIFDPERKTITIRSGKVKASQISRNVCLSDKGLHAVEEYLALPSKPYSLPPEAVEEYKKKKARQAAHLWQENLIRWAQRSRLVQIPGQEETNNPTGITVRTTRKSWESWLLAAYPEKIVNITLSQGHTETTALRHYFNISFLPEEKEAIKSEVIGWGCL